MATQAELLPALTTPSPLSALASMIVEGAAVVTPVIDTQTLLSDTTLPLFPNVLSQCLPTLAAGDNLGGLAPSTLLREGADLAPLIFVLTNQNPARSTAPPIFLAQGTADTTVFPQFTTQLNSQMQALGNAVEFVEYPGITHAGIVAAAENDVLPWMQERLPAP